ncbi:MAG: gliding motility-associated C-terminal domain-containing protein [Chitinophagales bacterium]|nr:gliding motility-associated C-terminal domain-containing protein [Chitinophagales bacterium]
MKVALHKARYLLTILMLLVTAELWSNGCTGSWFTMQYSPWCNCWQVCGNYISDCDEIVSLSWNFGDGTTATGPSPCHQFPGPGTYTVTMTVVAYCHNSFFNLFTSTCHITQQVTVTNTTPPLQANFVADTPCLGEPTHFTATPITPSGTNTFTWVWPDGTTSTGANPTHVFDSCGAYDVMMIVSNTTPCCSIAGKDTIIKRIYIDCNPFNESNSLGETEPYIQESSAYLQVTSGTCPGDTTHFLVTPNGSLTNWLFVFPDSSMSFSPNPWYVYNNCPPAIDYTYIILFTNRGCLGRIDSVTGIFCPSNVHLTSTTTLCTDQCNGTATAALAGGTPPYSYTWSDPNNQTTATATGLCPGNYVVTVTDGNGCTATPPPVTVNNFPFPFSTTVNQNNNLCCNGWACTSAILTYTGGTPPYTSLWSNGNTTTSVTGLYGGNQSVTSTDAHGCVYVNSFVVPEPPPLSASFNVTNTNCGTCTGSVTVVPGGGNGTYTIKWLNPANIFTATINNLCAGVYTVEISDAAVFGCRDTFTVTVSSNGAQPITATSTNATCSNICNGTATVNFTGGCQNPPCNVAWLDSAGTPIGQTSSTATNLCQGSYIVRVTNGINCISFANVTINVPNPIVPTATPTYNTCGTNCNGTITASGTGGSPPYTYQWYNAGTLIAGQTGSTIGSLCAGSYSVRFTDQQGCTVSASTNVFSNSLNATASATSVYCNGDCNGMITSIATGGVTPYNFLLQNASGGTVYSGNSNIIANLCAGNYTLVVTDAGNCSVNIPLVISQPAALTPTPTATNPLCFGSCNGAATVSVTGGTLPYQYEWRNSTGQLISNFSSVNNLCAGNYAVQIKDSNNCTTPFVPVVLIQPAKLRDSLNIFDPYCIGGQGAINLTPYGGTPPYTFNWNNGTYSTEDLSGLGSGTYMVVITDANNCTAKDTANFVQLPLLNVSIAPHLYSGYHFKCYNGNDGEVVAHVSGGLPPYTYQWNDSLNSTADSIYGLPPGTYTLTVTDANGCVRVDSVSLNLIPPPFSLNETHQDVLCFGESTGSITITPVGGVPPYIGYWQHDNNLFALQLSNIDTGRYVVFVFDSVFCLRIDTIDILQPAPVQVSHSITNASCSGVNNGSVDLTVSGGTVPYSFNWNSGTYTTEDISGLGAGTYNVVVTDSNSCTVTDVAVVSQPPAMATSITPSNVTCFTGSDGSVSLNVTGGNQPYSFSWNNGLYTSQNLQNVSAGVYTVVVTDAQNCTTADTTTITEPPLITGSRLITICATDSFFTGGAYQNTAGVYTDVLQTANGCDSVLSTNLAVVNEFFSNFDKVICYGQTFVYNGNYYTAAGTYSQVLKSKSGCDSTVTFTLSILPDINLSAAPNSAKLVLGDTVTISLITSNPGEIISYSWSPAGGLSCNNCQTVTANPQASTQYVAVAIDSNGCMDTVLIPILVNGPVIFIPNVFTPNSDGANDFFEIYGNLDAIRYIDIQIFNRWGEKVFESNNHHFKWDGTYKGVKQNPAVFVYVIKVAFNNEQPEKIYKGSVTLMR